MSTTSQFQTEYNASWEREEGFNFPMHSLYSTVLRNWIAFCGDVEIADFVIKKICEKYPPDKNSARWFRAWYGFHVHHGVPGVCEFYIPEVISIVLKENDDGLYKRYIDILKVLDTYVDDQRVFRPKSYPRIP